MAIPETRGQISVEINQIFAERNKVEIPEKKEEIAVVGPPTPALLPRRLPLTGSGGLQVPYPRLPSLSRDSAPGLQEGSRL